MDELSEEGCRADGAHHGDVDVKILVLAIMAALGLAVLAIELAIH
ncbi:hypothetical protein [Arthrobacter sp. ZGTC131]|nr:hypothetical protein [Arthrobacter sp. ZGTC131]